MNSFNVNNNENKKEVLSSSSNSNEDESINERNSIQNMNFNISFFENKNNKSIKNSLDSEIKEEKDKVSLEKEKLNENKKIKKNENNSREKSSDNFDVDEDSNNNIPSNSFSSDDEDDEEKEKEDPNKNKIDEQNNEIEKQYGLSLINANSKNNIFGGDTPNIKKIKDGHLFGYFYFYMNKNSWYIKNRNNEDIAKNLTTYELFENLLDKLRSNFNLNNFIVNISPSYSQKIAEFSTFKLFMKLYEYFNNQLVIGNLKQNIQQSNANVIYNQSQNHNSNQNEFFGYFNYFYGNGNINFNNDINGFGYKK